MPEHLSSLIIFRVNLCKPDLVVSFTVFDSGLPPNGVNSIVNIVDRSSITIYIILTRHSVLDLYL